MDMTQYPEPRIVLTHPHGKPGFTNLEMLAWLPSEAALEILRIIIRAKATMASLPEATTSTENG